MTPIHEILPIPSPSNANSATCALEEIPVVYLEMDTNGIITYANRAARDFHGLEKGMVGHSAWDRMPVEERHTHEEAYRQLLASGQTPPVVRSSLYGEKGYRTMEIHRSLMRSEVGDVLGVRSVSIDVTEASIEHAEAQRAKLWMESVLASVAEAVLVTDSLGFVRMVNHAAESLFRWKAGELIGQILERKIPLLEYTSADGSRLSFQMALHGPAKGSAKILNRFREELQVEISASPVIDRENGYTAGVVSLWRLSDGGAAASS